MHDGPAAVRYPRGQGPGVRIEKTMSELAIGRAEVRREGRSGLLILAFGTMVAPCVAIAERLDATLVNMRFVKPLDLELLERLVPVHRAVVTVEENVVAGGAGSAAAREASMRRSSACARSERRKTACSCPRRFQSAV